MWGDHCMQQVRCATHYYYYYRRRQWGGVTCFHSFVTPLQCSVYTVSITNFIFIINKLAIWFCWPLMFKVLPLHLQQKKREINEKVARNDRLNVNYFLILLKQILQKLQIGHSYAFLNIYANASWRLQLFQQSSWDYIVISMRVKSS